MSQADYIMRKVREMMDAELSKREVDCLSGCTRCGRRLVVDDRPIEGAVLAYPPNDVGSTPKPFCGDCMSNDPEDCFDILASEQR